MFDPSQLRMSNEPTPPSAQANIDAGIKMSGMARQGQQAMVDAKSQVDKTEFTIDPINNTATFKGSADIVRSLLESRQKVDQYQNLYNNMIAENLRKQQQMREHPFANTLAELAASFARNDPNPYTRAVGQAATRLNPSMQELQGEERGMLKEAETFATRREAIDANILRTMEGAEAKSQMGFNRFMVATESMAKNGMDNPEAYFAMGRKAGVDDETLKAMVPGLVEQAKGIKQFKANHEKFIQDKASNELKVKQARQQADAQFQRVRGEVLRTRAQIAQTAQNQKTMDPIKIAQERRRLIALKEQLRTGVLKSYQSAQRTAGELLMKHLGNSALDRDHSYKDELMGYIGDQEQSVQMGAQSVQAAMDEIDSLLGALDGQKGTASVLDTDRAPKPVIPPLKTKKKEAPPEEEGIWGRIFGSKKDEKKGKTKSGVSYELVGQ